MTTPDSREAAIIDRLARRYEKIALPRQEVGRLRLIERLTRELLSPTATHVRERAAFDALYAVLDDPAAYPFELCEHCDEPYAIDDARLTHDSDGTPLCVACASGYSRPQT